MAGFFNETFSSFAISATTQLNPNQKNLGGIFCSSSTSGTATIYDSATSATTTLVVASFPLVAGTFYRLPFSTNAGIYIVIGGTASITVGAV